MTKTFRQVLVEQGLNLLKDYNLKIIEDGTTKSRGELISYWQTIKEINSILKEGK